MTTFTYDENVPTPSHNPSTDVTTMQSNAQSIDGILEVDHVGFNATSGGTHLQTTFSSKNTPGAQTDPASTLYTANGTASSVADLFYKNQNGTFRPNIIKASGKVQTILGTGAVAVTNGYNVVSAVQNTISSIQVTLVANAVVGSSCVILHSIDAAGLDRIIRSSSVSGNVLSIGVNGFLNTDTPISFAILQV